MKLVKLMCPNCNAKLEVNSEMKQFTCNYCGTTTMLDNEDINININGKFTSSKYNNDIEDLKNTLKFKDDRTGVFEGYEYCAKYPKSIDALYMYLSFILKQYSRYKMLPSDAKKQLDTWASTIYNSNLAEKTRNEIREGINEFKNYNSYNNTIYKKITEINSTINGLWFCLIIIFPFIFFNISVMLMVSILIIVGLVDLNKKKSYLSKLNIYDYKSFTKEEQYRKIFKIKEDYEDIKEDKCIEQKQNNFEKKNKTETKKAKTNDSKSKYMYCSNCGEKIDRDSKYCENCGERV